MSKCQIISFITCVNNDLQYKKALSFINNLHYPENITVETMPIRSAKSMTEGYNIGMKLARGRYKVYLHQDVWIINPYIINHLLSIFQNNNDIGMVGVIGAKSLPPSCVWWESENGIGSVVDSHTGQFEIIDYCSLDDEKKQYKEATAQMGESYKNFHIEYEKVEAIDGLFMATQYDIDWREDLFDGWHFYDISQCYEFKKRQYDIVVPYQAEPWCIHDCGYIDMTHYEKYREIFVNEYR